MNADGWGEQLVARIPADVRRALASDPHGTLQKKYQLSLEPVAAPDVRGNGGWCDGLSILKGRRILYVSGPGRRENFTLLHEFGHFLVDETPAVLVWAADQPDPARAVEEVCNAVAALLLVPHDLIEEVVGVRKPTAADILTLYGRSRASRQVCAIAVAERLGCRGFVCIVERATHKIQFSSRVADTQPYAWRDDLIPPLHALRQATAGDPVRRESGWPYSDGQVRPYWLDAVADDRYAYAIFAERDLWGTTAFHGVDAIEDRPVRPATELRCSSCGFTGSTRRFPCSDCHQPPCPRCERCECDRRSALSRPCSQCHLVTPKQRMRGDLCVDCANKPRRTNRR